MAPILVTGGTGTLGRHVVRRLKNQERDVRVLTRRAGLAEEGVQFVTGDLLSPAGLETAVDGVATIIHCAGSNKGDDVATQNLVTAASRGARPHVVYISVVGAERMPVTGFLDRMMFSYFSMKRNAELTVANSGLPFSVLRATQFHDLMLKVASALAKSPVVPFPSGVAFQPVDADEVAARLVELASGQPSGFVPDIGGPRVYDARDLFGAYLKAAGKRRLLLPVWLPGDAAGALRNGANLTPEHADGKRTWEEFLTEHVSNPRHHAERRTHPA